MASESEYACENPQDQRNVPFGGAVSFFSSDGIKSKMRPTALGALLLLAACATDRVVEGRIASTGETFTGTWTPGDWGGKLEMDSDRTRCTGRSTGSEAIGTTVVVLLCDDGRAGSAVLVDGPTRASGSGILGDDQVSITIAHQSF
jgi:hypothetical protein